MRQVVRDWSTQRRRFTLNPPYSEVYPRGPQKAVFSPNLSLRTYPVVVPTTLTKGSVDLKTVNFGFLPKIDTEFHCRVEYLHYFTFNYDPLKQPPHYINILEGRLSNILKV